MVKLATCVDETGRWRNCIVSTTARIYKGNKYIVRDNSTKHLYTARRFEIRGPLKDTRYKVIHLF